MDYIPSTLPRIAGVSDTPEALAAWLATLTPEQQATIEQLGEDEERDRCEESLAYFVLRAWKHIDPAPYQHNWHIDAICDHLEAVARGELRHGIINQPPRTMKSLITNVCFPAWVWAQRSQGMALFRDSSSPSKDISLDKVPYRPLMGPHVKFFCASYGETLSFDIAIIARRLIECGWYQRLWGHRFQLSVDQNSKGKFDTDKGGYRISTSVEAGRTTGQGGDIIIIDDPHNTQKTESEAEIDKVLRWWDRALPTRLNNQNTGVFIIVMQRQKEDDLTGHILSTASEFEDWWHIMFPMRFDPERTVMTPLGYSDPRSEDGELLWEERFPENVVRILEKKLGPYGSSGQLQQSPQPKGGGIIKRDWWEIFPPPGEENAWMERKTLMEDGVPVERDVMVFPAFDYVLASLDPAYTRDKENDYSALTAWGVWRNKNGVPKIMLIAGWQKRLEIHGSMMERRPFETTTAFLERTRPHWGLVEWVGSVCRRFSVDKLLIENTSAGQSVAQEIRRLFADEGWSTQLVQPRGDKVSRMYSVQHLFSEGMIFAPDRDWAEQVIGECEKFPKGEHDDIPDSVSQALFFLRTTGWALRMDEKSRSDSDKATFKGVVKPLYDV